MVQIHLERLGLVIYRILHLVELVDTMDLKSIVLWMYRFKSDSEYVGGGRRIKKGF